MSADERAPAPSKGLEVHQRIEQDSELSRRTFLGGAAAVAVASTMLGSSDANAGTAPNVSYAASPPAGFRPFAAPGRIVKVKKSNSMMPNGFYPKEADAKAMLQRALQELTGESDMAKAAGKFVHKDDKVCVKVNGIALKNMGTNRELVIPFLEAMIASGVKPENITVLEQYGSFLSGTRIDDKSVPAGVKVAVHNNGDATMQSRIIPGTNGTSTKFVRVLTESTALINFSLIKDHSICGYTGCLKNVTHGCSINPHDFHLHHASPQIALLAAQDVIKSRIRLCITDGFKVMAQGGPLWKKPEYVVPHEAVYVTTDMVAMDTIGWEIVEKERANFKLKSLTDDGRPPEYIKEAGELGLGIADRTAIQLREIVLG
jgi:uncharacterized protein (DUF362 family)